VTAQANVSRSNRNPLLVVGVAAAICAALGLGVVVGSRSVPRGQTAEHESAADDGGIKSEGPVIMVTLKNVPDLSGMDASDARARMATQASEDAYARICDAVILNDSSLAEFELKLTEIWEGRLVPYALNLSEGRRIGAKGPQASSGRLLHATRRAQARLECHGVAAAVKAPGQLEILSKAPETAMRAAGFVPDEPGYASADPVVLVRARMRDA
jgi:hypothetical protein